ncbi:MAG: VWA domain-containing protein [Gemmataceae bacterium]
MAHRIPYRVAASVVRAMTPEVVSALVETMTPMELINGVAALQKRGQLDDEQVKGQVERKLAAAKTDDRVSAFKAEVAAEAAAVGDELAETLRAVTDARLRARGTITRPTALLLDRSGSMTEAIEVGKRLGAMGSAVAEAGVYCVVFDTQAQEITPAGPQLADWERALHGVVPGGGTSIGVAVEALRQANRYVEQLVLVTDEGENAAPLFVDAYARYVEALKVRPAVTILRIGQATTQIEQGCKGRGIPVSVFRFDGDYYALPNVLPLLAQPSQTELLMEILDHPLPRRKAS